MAIEFNCPKCDAAVRVGDAAAGRIGRCPKCSTRIKVPHPPKPPASAEQTSSPAAPTLRVRDAADASPAPPIAPPNEAAEDEAPVLPGLPGGPPAPVPADEHSPADSESPPNDVLADSIPGPLAISEPEETSYARRLRKKKRNWAGLLIPLFCGGVLAAIGVGYWWMTRETMTGTLTGERLPAGETVSGTLRRFVPEVSDDTWRAALTELSEDPIVIRSDLMTLRMRGSRSGIDVLLTAGPETALVRVDVRQNRLLNEFYAANADRLDARRVEELQQAATRFLRDWETAADGGMLLGNAQVYRDSVGLNVLRGGLGYHSVALVGTTIYPCVHEDASGLLYFVVPHDVETFVVTERDRPDGGSVFPGEYRFDVHIIDQESTADANAASPHADEDDATEVAEPAEPALTPSDEEMEGEPLEESLMLD